MDAVDLSMRGWAIMNQPTSLERARQARDLFEAALRLDPLDVDALLGFAHSHLNEVRFLGSIDRDEQMRMAEAAVTKALTLVPHNAFAHFVRGQVLHVLRAPDLALREDEIAISLDRNLAWAHADIGFVKILLGRAEETEGHIADAMRLSPRDPGLHRWYAFLGISYLYIGKLGHAVDWLQRSVGLNPNLALPYFFLAAALALMDRGKEAADACAAGRRLDPSFSVARFRGESRSDNSIYLAQREHIHEGMRKAGVPEA
jgi:tetratricopeptide (TPR) repeat protein